jgi:predicted RNase H-like HicB family nuclease
MLIEYIDKAMSKASYDKLEDGSFSGKIAQCPGVIAFGSTLYQCEQELKSSLEGWLIVKIRHGDKLPVPLYAIYGGTKGLNAPEAPEISLKSAVRRFQ